MRPGERLITIDELKERHRPAYAGYKSLNRMQSAVFPIAYLSNENMLVCAPTGAGKTDVAMLSILHCLDDFYEGDKLQTSRFKMVYMAPMKALATEVVAKFSKRLKPFGVRVREWTGDMQLTRSEIDETQIFVTTPEKWDVVTRKDHSDVKLIEKLKLVLIDEVHLLNDERGAVLEVVVARTLRQVEQSQKVIRIVGLSATLPNYVDVALFLK